ncbi:hypothetical protein PENANT_c098G05098 [Penicillium antarcticum]|uniref:Uncharacterized protein n=1 Tax=Penicillium antarcticum TaxID=416450 RepID=A0A1V6PHG0_9EURO|nr:uncharacterized protein N7508_011106 [Penicillium antarcticum]XP_058317861.1 uncharacterized protein N7508_007395 [Penicillium antarcticum]KAJ5288331.1 hypothetical protein N7508_011106 [Penicillium antarcticum]KAJ5300152.1 hypothetical protein N7508_007395 [Penicillium antarcticum]OQD76273.1 hypothetical protein PENANT_c129G01017 [Penicillium antarcticum]OQD76713.1 hypothetical protein PENANT_c126G05491 [Penicillium antarcticum]OQD78017.1 hypothetical protein PENANT_c098G05098 [Penicilliu
MSLLDLPLELLFWVADNLDGAQDLLALVCLNKAANASLLPSLYQFNVRRQRSSALFWGVLKGNAEFVEKMLRGYQADVNTTDDKSRTPIFYALRAQNQTIIRMLLSDPRTDIDWQDKHKQTPLIYTIARNALSADSLLLDFKPRLNRRDEKKRSAIWYAVAHCHEGLVQVLLGRGSVIRMSDYRNISSVGLAIVKKSAEVTRMLLHHRESDTGKCLLEDDNVRDHLLHRAVKVGFHDIIALLVTHGANPNTRNRNGQSLLHQAAERGDKEVLQHLLTYEQTSADARDRFGRTAFHIAAEHGQKSIARLLLTCSAVDINALDNNGATALCLAVQAERTAIALQILAEDHVDLNVKGQNGSTALHSAAKRGNVPIAAVLLNNHDLDPNIRDDEEWTPLTCAASRGDLCMVELLLARTDIQVNVPQASPLFHAAREDHRDVVRRLLCLDTIDINQKFWDFSPLCVASEMGHLEITRLLLKHRPPPDLNLKTYMGDTALSLAACHGQLSIIDLLLKEKGLDVTASDKLGDTAICKAARNGHEHVVQRLFKDPRAKDGNDMKVAIETSLTSKISLYLQGRLNAEGNFRT